MNYCSSISLGGEVLTGYHELEIIKNNITTEDYYFQIGISGIFLNTSNTN